VLRRWLRQAKKLNYTKEKMVYVSEPKIGESLGDEEARSFEDLLDYEEVGKENPGFHVGKEERRLFESLRNSKRSLGQQEVLTENKVRLSKSLKNS